MGVSNSVNPGTLSLLDESEAVVNSAKPATVQLMDKNKDTVKVASFANPVELANTAAQDWLAQLAARPPDPGNYCVALSGGRIAKTFSSAVAKLAATRKYTFPSVHFFWGDERCVPAADPESNFAIAQQLIFGPLGIPDKQIHRIRGEDDPERAAAAAEAELRRFASSSSSGRPVLDMIFLGLGEDGHTASLFPGEPSEMIKNTADYRAVIGPKPPPRRITLGYLTIAAAEQVWVLASGEGKENALHESLKPDARTPLGRVLNLRSYTKIYTDIQVPKP
jgi:6-phosphogluconolactonase